MNALTKLRDAVEEKIRIAGELGIALGKKSRGCPGWDPTIKKLQNRLFGLGEYNRGIFGNPGNDFVPYSSGPLGSYDFATDRADRKRVQQGGINSVTLFKIPVSTVGLVAGYNPFYCDHNGLQILARTMDDNGNITESSDTARVFIRVNTPNSPWLPIGFAFAPQGVSKSDNLVFQGYVEKFWLYVQTPTQDPQNQPVLLLALLRSVALFGPGGGSNLYGSPTAVTSPTESSITIVGAAPGQTQGGSGGGGGDGSGKGGGGTKQSLL